MLVYLVSHRDRVVPKEELMDAIWGGRFVTETAVTSRIKQVRRARRRRRPGPAGDPDRARPRLPVRRTGAGRRDGRPSRPDGLTGPVGPVRYTTSDGLHIAYQVSGRTDGVGPDIVLISGFVSHLELDWEDPRHAHFLHRLGSMGRLIRFDKRGTGMSDRPPGVPDLETRIHDVLAVMDAVGSRRAVLVRLLRGRTDGAADGRHAPGAGRRAGAVRRLREAPVVGGLPVGADRGGAGGLHRRAGRPGGTGRPTARMRMPVRRRVHAAVVGAPDARLGHARRRCAR